MTPHHLVREAMKQWFFWRSRKAIRRAMPVLEDLDRREREKRRRHGSGVRDIQQQRQALMTARIRQEAGLN